MSHSDVDWMFATHVESSPFHHRPLSMLHFPDPRMSSGAIMAYGTRTLLDAGGIGRREDGQKVPGIVAVRDTDIGIKLQTERNLIEHLASDRDVSKVSQNSVYRLENWSIVVRPLRSMQFMANQVGAGCAKKCGVGWG